MDSSEYVPSLRFSFDVLGYTPIIEKKTVLFFVTTLFVVILSVYGFTVLQIPVTVTFIDVFGLNFQNMVVLQVHLLIFFFLLYPHLRKKNGGPGAKPPEIFF